MLHECCCSVAYYSLQNDKKCLLFIATLRDFCRKTSNVFFCPPSEHNMEIAEIGTFLLIMLKWLTWNQTSTTQCFFKRRWRLNQDRWKRRRYVWPQFTYVELEMSTRNVSVIEVLSCQATLILHLANTIYFHIKPWSWATTCSYQTSMTKSSFHLQLLHYIFTLHLWVHFS